MATLTSINSDVAPSPLAMWHLLSLDAPTIAALWTWFIAWSTHTRLPLLSPVAMFLAVWNLYAADRLLDARCIASAALSHGSISPDLEARHLFHARFRSRFLFVIGASTLLLAVILPGLPASALRLDALLGTLLAGYFILIHATPVAQRLPKEIAVGAFFAAAVFIPTIARDPSLRSALLPAALLFGALCSLNCLCIYGWEHRAIPRRHSEEPALRAAAGPHPATRFALTHLPLLHFLLLTLALLVALRSRSPIALAVAIAAAGLLALDRVAPRLCRIDLRAAADLALATPLLVAPLVFLFDRLHR